jgi:hypothetical protein
LNGSPDFIGISGFKAIDGHRNFPQALTIANTLLPPT